MHEATLTVLNTMNTSNCFTSSNTFQMIVIIFYSISYSLYVINNVSWESDITSKKDKRPRCNFCSDISFKGGGRCENFINHFDSKKGHGKWER